MRTSTGMSRVSPTRRTFSSCSTRSSFTCTALLVSPISSRKSVPPSAASKSPFLSLTAPVNEPLTCPNSSLSSSVSVRAPQLIDTSGRARRGLCAWIARATSSLPVPLSPVMSTVLLRPATRPMTLKISTSAGLSPIRKSVRASPRTSITAGPPSSSRLRASVSRTNRRILPR